MVRIVEGVRGSVAVRMELALRFDYGRTVPWVTRIEDGVRAVAGPNLAVLHASVPVHGENLKTVAEFTVRKGQRAWFTLTYGAPTDPIRSRSICNRALKDTVRYLARMERAAEVQGQISRSGRALADHAEGA